MSSPNTVTPINSPEQTELEDLKNFSPMGNNKKNKNESNLLNNPQFKVNAIVKEKIEYLESTIAIMQEELRELSQRLEIERD